MAYRLKIGRPVDEEVRRVSDRQLAAAIERIRSHREGRRQEAIHVARRHVKKVRALLRLVGPVLSGPAASERQLRMVNQMLAPLTDGNAIVTTWAELARSYRDELPRHALPAMRRELEHRLAAANDQARLDHVLEAAADMLHEERRRVDRWRLGDERFRALAPGLEQSVRAARRAMQRCRVRPTAEAYHTWRRRVKTLWLQLRLLQSRCGAGLVSDERRLERLDGVLGECHDCALLQDVLRSGMALPTHEVAHCLRVLRRHHRALRARAQSLAGQIHQEKARPFVRRAKRLWRAQNRRAAQPVHEAASWRAAA